MRLAWGDRLVSEGALSMASWMWVVLGWLSTEEMRRADCCDSESGSMSESSSESAAGMELESSSETSGSAGKEDSILLGEMISVSFEDVDALVDSVEQDEPDEDEDGEEEFEEGKEDEDDIIQERKPCWKPNLVLVLYFVFCFSCSPPPPSSTGD